MELTNKFKQKLATGELQIGIWNGLPDTYVAEILAGSGFDWVLIDGEHAPFDLRSVLAQMQAMARFDVPVLVRPPSGDAVFIKQLLDAGAQSLVVPMVETAAQAADLYRAMQYPPLGIRGVGTALSRAAQWNRTPDYFKKSGGEMCLIVQVESVAGLENLEEILAVEGVDGVFLGPADLAGSMNYLGQPEHPAVKAALENAIRKIRSAGKTAGILAVSRPAAEHYIACGANMVAVAVDTLLLAKAASETASFFKK